MATKATAPSNFKRNRSFISTGAPRNNITFTWTPGSIGSGTTFYGYRIYKKNSDNTYTFVYNYSRNAGATVNSNSLTISATNSYFDDFFTGEQTVNFAIQLAVSTDGGQNSNPTYNSDFSNSVSLKFNQKPVVTIGNAEPYSPYEAFGSDGIGGSSLGYCAGLYPKNVKTTKKGTVSFIFETEGPRSINNTNAWGTDTSPNYKERVSRQVAFTANETKAEISSCSANSAIDYLYGALASNRCYKWRLKVVLNDGTEDSEPVYFPENNQYYRTPGAPLISNSYNQHANSDVTGTDSNTMYQKVRLKWLKDTSCSVSSVSCMVGNDSVSVSFSNTGTDGDYRYLDITINQTDLMEEAQVIFTVDFTNNVNSLHKTVTIDNYYQPAAPVLNKILVANNSALNNINPYKADASTIYIYINNPRPDNKQYALPSNLSLGTGYGKIQFGITNNTGTIRTQYADIVYSTLELDQTNWRFTFPKNKLYDLILNPLQYLDYIGTKDFWVFWSITNLFGRKYISPTGYVSSSDPNKYQFNFGGIVENITMNVQQRLENESTYSNFGDYYVQEGLYLKFNISFTYYSFSSLTITPWYQFPEEEKQYYPSVSPYTPQLLNRTPQSQTYSYERSVPVGVITREGNVSFGVTIQTNGTNTYTGTSIPVIKYYQPSINFTKYDIGSNNMVTYQFTISNIGYNTTQVDTTHPLDSGRGYYFYYNGTTLGDTPLSTTGAGTVDLTSELDWTSAKIQVCSSPTFKSDIARITSVTPYFSNELSIFKAGPTVSYRPNRIGINGVPATDAIADIKGYGNDINHVYVRDATDSIIVDINTILPAITLPIYEKTETPTSNWTGYNGSTQLPTFRRMGNLVIFDWACSPISSGQINNSTVCSVPPGFTPVDNIVSIGQGSYNGIFMQRANTDGTIVVGRFRDFSCTASNSYISVPSGYWVPIHLVYFTSDAYPTNI